MATSKVESGAVHEIPLERIAREGVVRVRVDGVEILAARTRSGFRAYSGVCPHLGGPLLEAECEDGVLRCPWHGYRFDLESARCLTAPGGPWQSLVGAEEPDAPPMSLGLGRLRTEEDAEVLRIHLRRSAAGRSEA